MNRYILYTLMIFLGFSLSSGCGSDNGFTGRPEKAQQDKKKDTAKNPKDTNLPPPSRDNDPEEEPDTDTEEEPKDEEPKTPNPSRPPTDNPPSEPSTPSTPEEPKPNPSGMYDPLQEIRWTQVKDYGDVKENGSPTFRDVVGHTDPNDEYAPRANGLKFDPDSVAVHETGHMLHFQIRNLEGAFDETKEGIYYRDGKGVVFTRPKTKITEFRDQIATFLKDEYSPNDTYLINQPNNFPTHDHISYLFNEWGCYLMNIRMLLELEEANKAEDDSKGHAANHSPHFFGYVAYGLKKMADSEPSALQDKQFKAAFALYAQETWDLMRRSLKSPVFGKDSPGYGPPIKKYMVFYRSSADFAAAKSNLESVYGKAWVDHLMRD